ncbi:MAG: hypothetical protein AMXMBFR64_35110 [Myxococcales bacterium]
MTPVLVASAVLPSLLIMGYFRSRDLSPEPGGTVWATFALGIVIVIPVLAVALPVAHLVGGSESPWVSGAAEAFLVAAIPEESFKLLVVWGFAARRRAFDEPMDGIVYGVVASLGFATLENVLYVADGGTAVAILRALTAVPGHAFLGAIMGAFVGRARFDSARRSTLLLAAWAWPVLLHGLYDWPLLTLRALEATGGASSGMTGALALATLTVLIAEGRWALRVTRSFRADQALALGVSVPAPPPTERGAGGWARLLAGSVLASAGGLVLLGAIVGLSEGTTAADGSTLTAAALFGAAPLALGLRWFRHGLRPPGA